MTRPSAAPRLPLPPDSEAWDGAAGLFQRAAEVAGEAERRSLLLEMAMTTLKAFEVPERERGTMMDWWSGRQRRAEAARG